MFQFPFGELKLESGLGEGITRTPLNYPRVRVKSWVARSLNGLIVW